MIHLAGARLGHQRARSWRWWLPGLAVAVALGASASLWWPSGRAPQLTNGVTQVHEFYASEVASPGTLVDFPVLVKNPGHHRAVLLSAELIAVPGFTLPHLAHLAVLREHRVLLDASRGWPIDNHPCEPGLGVCHGGHQTLQAASLHGFVVEPEGHHRGKPGPFPDIIEYTVRATKSGYYGIAGLRVQYKVGSSTATVRLYGGGLYCASTAPRNCPESVDSRFGEAFDTVAQ